MARLRRAGSSSADGCNHIYEDAELSRASKSYSCRLQAVPSPSPTRVVSPTYSPTTNSPMLTSRIFSFFMRKSSASCTFSIFCA